MVNVVLTLVLWLALRALPACPFGGQKGRRTFAGTAQVGELGVCVSAKRRVRSHTHSAATRALTATRFVSAPQARARANCPHSAQARKLREPPQNGRRGK